MASPVMQRNIACCSVWTDGCPWISNSLLLQEDHKVLLIKCSFNWYHVHCPNRIHIGLTIRPLALKVIWRRAVSFVSFPWMNWLLWTFLKIIFCHCWNIGFGILTQTYPTGRLINGCCRVGQTGQLGPVAWWMDHQIKFLTCCWVFTQVLISH